MKLCYYQLFDVRQGVRENLMKGQGVRVHIKVKNHWSMRSFSSAVAHLHETMLVLLRSAIAQ